ncbi:hypothetical protein [Solitalea canadensis]|uniref:Uncharacterized protein n=1 Tax=Solitalea canadensis (strain ATCC 29591 / DSM 3403 / JCM 21819 / LMG 8368 / NBRC 15130 / NCIMB 12057 / USAM 9D) TaxID=929556 RepID=H8KQ65_SOLCM|nr:hypothetical protein [Solitalea canadensis]AFD06233.1 hypothetical protein Solca_1128 [Solitalea canadensis DSM 3403]
MKDKLTSEIPQVKLSVEYNILEKNILLPKISIEAIGVNAINKNEIDTIVKHLDDFSEFIKTKLEQEQKLWSLG